MWGRGQNVQVYKVDVERQLVFLKGHVPGHRGNVLYITDAIKKRPNDSAPFPTFDESQPEHLALPRVLSKSPTDPLMWGT